MLLVTYNINGFRSAASRGLVSWLRAVNADVVALQEVRARRDQVELDALRAMGYKILWNAAQRPGYSGVAVLTKLPVHQVVTQTGVEEIDQEGRLIKIDFGNWMLINGYFPTGAAGPKRMAYKLKFLEVVANWLKGYPDQTGKPVLLAGDFNIALR